ncbi:MAG: HD domain-containing protein [Cyanobacteria bacterium SZAS TMP-1]|nr:HD domain-containing protein [Cyanobacteria bacterium SZAS TMP-1]
MNSPFVQQITSKLNGVRDLKRILETTVKDVGDHFSTDACQIILSNPLDPNITSICEYRSTGSPVIPGHSATLPLVLQGRTFGSLTLSRSSTDVSNEELNVVRLVLGELSDIIRLAQINDIVQRDTFRETFLVEIGNLMTYSLGIGDALFMVVNILGKALQVSRCLFICTDDNQAGWKCYEFWQQEKVQSLQQSYWPSADSALVAQTLLAREPLKLFEGQQNSYVSPAQEELQLINVKSFLGMALKSSEGTHGCVILQQCDYRRAWTRNEIDMLQNVADKVAEALHKLPAEKKAREPIMQLHQRTVSVPQPDAKGSAIDVRRALKGAMGQQVISQAAKTGQMPVPPQAKAPPPKPPAPPPPPPQPPQPVQQPQPVQPVQPVTPPQPVSQSGEITAAHPAIPPLGQAASQNANATGEFAAITGVPAGADPYADLDSEFGDFDMEPPAATPPAATAPPVSGTQSLTNITPPTVASASAGAWSAPPGYESAPAAPSAASEAVKSSWGDLDSIGTPAAASPTASAAAAPAAAPAPSAAPAAEPAGGGAWGSLDAIPTPAAASSTGRGGLGGSMLGRARGASGSGGPLKNRLGHTPPPPSQTAPPAAAAAPAEPAPEVDEATAKAKLDQILSSKTSQDATSDYIFATPGLDMRMLGRIDGWVSQIEAKDKYTSGHARAVAEYACAIAKEMMLPQSDIDKIRQAALVHDLGKLGSAANILQKPESELSDTELLLVMNHPMAGADLLEQFPDLAELAPIVRAHHEEFDGNGYPLGLKGDQIPLFARIIGVANHYHEKVSQKKSGPAMDPATVQNDMVANANKAWDPACMSALIQAILIGKVPAQM